MHPDAYKLMHYRASKGELYIWNARDGAAPQRIAIGKQRFDHLDAEADVFLPGHEPNLGDWVFVDAALCGDRPDGVPFDAPQLRQVDAVLWEYFRARAEGIEFALRHVDDLWNAKCGNMPSGDSLRS